MKNKFKFITGLATVAMAMPMLTIAASCSKTNYSSIVNTIKEDAIKEFTDICKVYRPTFRTRKICDYLKRRIANFGLEDSIQEDDYKSALGAESSGNLTFEIPATPGLESRPKLILQGHMDMVCALKKDSSGQPIEYDWETNGVIPVQEGDIIHSKDYNTTLGADDGIGVATLLSLAKNRGIYNHGPIRCIISADEEDSPTGVMSIEPSWVDAPYLVNVDWEYDSDIIVSCGGCNEDRFEHGFVEGYDTTVSGYEQFQIQISGLKGGHSATEIGKNKINGIVLMADLVEYIKHAPGSTLPIHFTSIESAGLYTSIPESVKFTFCVPEMNDNEGETLAKLQTYCQRFAAYSQFAHPIETDLKIEVTQLADAEKKTHALSLNDSNKLLEYITLLPFGPISYVEGTTGVIETSGNIGGIIGAKSDDPKENYFCLEYNSDWEPATSGAKEGPMRLTFGIQGRSSNPLHLGPNHKSTPWPEYGFFSYIMNATKHVFDDSSSFKPENYVSQVGWLPPWPASTQSTLTEILYKAGAENKNPMAIDYTLAWAECGAFYDLKPDIQMACIGFLIDDAHKNTETLHVSSISNTVFNLIYLFDHMPLTVQGGK